MGWVLRRIRKCVFAMGLLFVAPVFSADILCQNLFRVDPMQVLYQKSVDHYKINILTSQLYEPLTATQSRYLQKMMEFQESDTDEKRMTHVTEWEDLYIAERHGSEDVLGLLYDPYWRSVRDIIFIQWVQAGMGDQILKWFDVTLPSLHQMYLVRRDIESFLKGTWTDTGWSKSKLPRLIRIKTWLFESERSLRLDLEYQLMKEGASRPEWPQFVSYLVEHIKMKDIDWVDCASMLKRLSERLQPIDYHLPEVARSLVFGMSDIFELLQRSDLKKKERLFLENFLQEWINSLSEDSSHFAISPLEILKKSANLDQDLVRGIEKLQRWKPLQKEK